jgi:hypothetical protein
MSRINYCDDEDFQNQAFLWEANQERSIKGRKGQAALRELEAALLALPEKQLIADELENAEGQVCAVGALARFKGKENPMVGDSFGSEEDNLTINEDKIERVTVDFAQELGVPRMVAIAIVHENDDEWKPVTPEQRYRRVLGWTQRQLSGKVGWLTKIDSRPAH